jgi:hypothetical protein
MVACRVWAEEEAVSECHMGLRPTNKNEKPKNETRHMVIPAEAGIHFFRA